MTINTPIKRVPIRHVSIKEAKNRLSELTRFAEDGETIVITRNGRAVADLKPHSSKKGFDRDALRRWKMERGYFRLAGPPVGDFDAAMDEDVLSTPLT